MSKETSTGAAKAALEAIATFEEWEYAGRPIGPAPELVLNSVQTASLIDHTLLKPDAGSDAVRKLCLEAEQYGFASVCVHSGWIQLCAELLALTSVEVCSVAGFPQGVNLTSVKRYEAQKAIDSGASEIDMVISVGRLKEGNFDYVANDIAEVVEASHAGGAIVKTIIETCLLTDSEKAAACALAKHAGADFVKTSTGFNGPGAKTEDVALMRFIVGPDVGVKAAGGIHSFDDLVGMVQAGATRIGASAGVQIMQGLKSGRGG